MGTIGVADDRLARNQYEDNQSHCAGGLPKALPDRMNRIGAENLHDGVIDWKSVEPRENGIRELSDARSIGQFN